VEALLFSIQSAVEACEGFPMDTDRMKFICDKANEARDLIGIKRVTNTADVSVGIVHVPEQPLTPKRPTPGLFFLSQLALPPPSHFTPERNALQVLRKRKCVI
jgi:hypothetical protein